MSFIISDFSLRQCRSLITNVPLCLMLSSTGRERMLAPLLRRTGEEGQERPFSSLQIGVVF